MNLSPTHTSVNLRACPWALISNHRETLLIRSTDQGLVATKILREGDAAVVFSIGAWLVMFASDRSEVFAAPEEDHDSYNEAIALEWLATKARQSANGRSR